MLKNSETPYVITFDSTHAAMDAEKRLLKTEAKVHVIPTPRQITANCGLSIKISGISQGVLESLLEELKIKKKALYRMESFTEIQKID